MGIKVYFGRQGGPQQFGNHRTFIVSEIAPWPAGNIFPRVGWSHGSPSENKAGCFVSLLSLNRRRWSYTPILPGEHLSVRECWVRPQRKRDLEWNGLGLPIRSWNSRHFPITWHFYCPQIWGAWTWELGSMGSPCSDFLLPEKGLPAIFPQPCPLALSRR